MWTVSLSIAVCALAGSPWQVSSHDAIRQDALQLGLAHVARGTDELPDTSAITHHREVEEPRLRARHERVLEEVERLGDHDWAGTYDFGGGIGRGPRVSISIAPTAGATYTWNGCLGLSDFNHGDITEVTSDRIRLDFAVDPALNKRWSATGSLRPSMSDEWIIVRWGDERYVIPSAQMIDFCNAVSSGSGRGFFFRRRHERSSTTLARSVGLPKVPPEYQPFLLTEPLTGSILAREEPRLIGTYVGDSEKALVRTQIDLGLRDGLLPGMLIDADIGLLGDVVAVQERTATVEFRFAAWRNGPMPGWCIRTGPRQSKAQ